MEVESRLGSGSLRRESGSLACLVLVLKVGIDPTRGGEGRQGTAERGGMRNHFGRSYVDPEIARKRRQDVVEQTFEAPIDPAFIHLCIVRVFQPDGEKVPRQLRHER